MNLVPIILVILSVSAAIGALSAAYSLKGRSTGNRQLLESNIQAYKDNEKLKDQRIAYLEGQVYSKDETIQKLSRGDK